MNTSAAPASKEVRLNPMSGGGLLVFYVVYLLALIAGVVFTAIREGEPPVALLILLIVSLASSPLVIRGFFIVPPRTAKVLVLFGKYRGSVREPGFYWANPFAQRSTVSLKAVNMASNTIKVNDLNGNPIEIGGVVVFQVRDTAQASFDVEDYRHYADVQIETAIRRLASVHPYEDHDDADNVLSLRGDSEEVAGELKEGLQERLGRAGIEVIEARISHLAYAPEIAAAMLQRQQAAAIIAARRKIVDGAVSMVEDALDQLAKKGVIDLDPERKAGLVGNLLIVLCGQSDAQPVINTGTMYN